MKTSLKLLAAVAALASAGTQVHANPITWGNSNSTWSNNSSWSGGVAPANDLITDTAVFNNTTFSFQPNTGTTRSVAGITVGDTATTTGALTFTNTAFTIGSGGVTVTGNGLTGIGLVNLNNNVKLGASQTWTNNAYSSTNNTAALKAGTISSGVAGNVVLTLTGTGSSAGTASSAIDLTGVISDGSGTVSIVAASTGSGAIVMSGANTFTGGVTVKSGILTIGATGGTVQTSAGTGTITLGDSAGSADATLRKGTNIINNAITVASGSGARFIQNGGTANSVFGGAVTLNKDLTVKVEGASGITSMAGGFTGTGNLSLKNAVNATGGTQPGGVNLILGDVNMTGSVINDGAFTAGALGVHTISSVIGTNVTGVTQNSAMGLILLGANTYSGDTILTAGKLTIANVAATSGISGTTALTDILTVTSTAGLYAGQSITGTGIAGGSYIAGITSGTTLIMNKVGTAAGSATDIAFGGLAGSIANSALDTTGSGTLTLTGITTPTFGGLKNSGAARDLASVFTPSTGGYSGVTSLTLNPGSGKSYSYSGNITNGAAAGMSLTKSGTGTQELSGANTYTGGTNVTAGTLLISGGNINSSAVTVAAGARLAYNSSTARTGAITLNGAGAGASNRATLSGTGTINTSVLLDNIGDTLSPGNSPGIQNYAVGQSWNSFTYVWETNNFTGTTAGVDFDQIAITGALNLTGGSGAYLLDLTSLTAGNISGNVPNFSEVNRSWTILTTTTGITGFNSANWTISNANFSSSPAWGGTWALNQSVNDLVLSYTAVPEPSTWALIAAAGTFFMIFRRRRNTV